MLDIDLSNRQKLILKAIIEEYVSSGEPVGSKVLTAKPYLEFSSATIRADMAYLEMLGLLEKTHTSSGRIPSVSGYKYYVEHLVTRDYEVVNHFPLIDKIFNDETLNKEQMIRNGNTTAPKAKIIDFNGQSKSITGWAKDIGISKQALSKRLKKLPVEKALTIKEK